MIAFFRELILKDRLLKLFSFVLAVMIWFTVYSIQRDAGPIGRLGMNTQRITFFNVPVGVLSSAQDVHNFKVEPREVEVTVEGNASLLEKLETKDVRALVDLSKIEIAGDLHVRIDISTPPGVAHVRVRPETVRVIIPAKKPLIPQSEKL